MTLREGIKINYSRSSPFLYVMFLLMAALFINNAGAAELEENTILQAKISPWLASNSSSSLTNGFLVILEDQVDLREARLHTRREDKVRSVHETLHGKAKKTQADLRKWLDERGIKYRSYSIVNMILIYGDETLIPILASRHDIRRIEGNPTVRGLKPKESMRSDSLDQGNITFPDGQNSILSPAAIEWNIAKIRAPEVWSTFDITGTGIVVAGNDTGVQWDHPALKNSYRGWNGSQAEHNYNWHDAIQTDSLPYGDLNPCGYNSSVPCDDYGHGTHTLGIIIGDDGGSNQIGVSPGAQWIACRNMDNGYGTLATYLDCMEFFLAPYPYGSTPSQGDPSKAPHIINNSWYCPPGEGCSYNGLLTAVENLRAAGIMVVVSAGNTGSLCSTIDSPPAIYDASFSIGATNSSDEIASFSSRGPVTIDGSNRLKPDISAPGVSITSAVPTNNYAPMSGTSMAAPHVAGAIALLWSASPSLIGNIDATEILLEENAVSLTSTQNCGSIPGAQAPNNTFGWGRLDIFSAVQDVLQGPIVKNILVEKDGTGAGTVTSNPSAINCGLKCNANFSEGSSITLAAKAQPGSVFTSWSGACTGTEDTCQVTVTGDLTITASFFLANFSEHKLRVARKKMRRGDGGIISNDGSITCTQDTKNCSAEFSHGTYVTLVPQVIYPNTFMGWLPSGVCPGTDQCTVVMDEARRIKGVFMGPNKLSVSIRSVHNGAGSITGPRLACPGVCKKDYQKDEEIALTAIPDGGSIFTEWVGCPAPAGDTCSVKMDKAYRIKAVFTGTQ